MCRPPAKGKMSAHGIPLHDQQKERRYLTSIMLTVTGARTQALVNGTLTSGMVGVPVTIEYDEAWEGLTKNLVCRCSKSGSADEEYRSILNVENGAVVAHEVMQAGKHLWLGVEGYSSDGMLVIPTTWAMCGVIQNGANTGADLSADPTLFIHPLTYIFLSFLSFSFIYALYHILKSFPNEKFNKNVYFCKIFIFLYKLYKTKTIIKHLFYNNKHNMTTVCQLYKE